MRRLVTIYAVAALVLAVSGATQAAVINVPADHTTIQAAINAANPGDTIIVAAGMYDSTIETFPIIVNKSVTLLGAQANMDPRPSQGGRTGSESIIDADETTNAVIQISASDVEINGFTITGGKKDMVEEIGSADNLLFCYNILYDDLATCTPGDEGIQIMYSNGVVIAYNYAYNICQDAFNLSSSTNSAVRYNEAHDIYSENAAIYCYDETNTDILGNLVYNVPNNDGIKLGDSGDGSTGGVVKDNIVHDCAEDGITIYASGVNVENNIIYNCGSENGALYLYDADKSTVTKNIIYDNTAIGLLMHQCSNVIVKGNMIYNNNDSDDSKYPGSAGVWITGSSDASTIMINLNWIYDNADYGVRNDNISVVNAENNWWGHLTGPYDPAGTTEVPPCTDYPTTEINADGLGNAVSNNVDYCPWANLSSISGYKFWAKIEHDCDPEYPLENWEVHLTGTDFFGNPVNETAFTNSDGRYTFANLLLGTYKVEEVFPPPPAVWVPVTPTSFTYQLGFGEDYIGPKFINMHKGPIVFTDPATNIGETTATLNGRIGDDGGDVCEWRFDWWSANMSASCGMGGALTTGQSFKLNVNGLKPGTLYYFQACANNSTGFVKGNVLSFTTLPLCDGTLLLVSPNGGEKLIAGSTYEVTWQTTGTVSNVLLEYSIDNGANWTDVNTVPNTGSYNWEVPDVNNSQQCLVRISGMGCPHVTDTSDAVFTIYRCKLAFDLNHDCVVNQTDYDLLMTEWLKCGNPFDPNCVCISDPNSP